MGTLVCTSHRHPSASSTNQESMGQVQTAANYFPPRTSDSSYLLGRLSKSSDLSLGGGAEQGFSELARRKTPNAQTRGSDNSQHNHE